MDEEVTYSAGDLSTPPDLRFIHFNDGESRLSCRTANIDVCASVYHVDASSSEPVGGVARFQTICDHYRNNDRFAGLPQLLTLFSGDAFNPSLESSVTKGMLGFPGHGHVNI